LEKLHEGVAEMNDEETLSDFGFSVLIAALIAGIVWIVGYLVLMIKGVA